MCIDKKLNVYIAETDGYAGDPEFFVIVAEDLEEAEDMANEEVMGEDYKIEKVYLLKMKKGVRGIAYTCC